MHLGCKVLTISRLAETTLRNTACRLHSLPQLSGRGPAEACERALKKPRLTHTLADIPEHTLRASELDWEVVCQRFVCIVDCQPLQQVLCGHSPLLNDELRPTFDIMNKNLAALLDAGWATPRLWHDPVIWRRREMNVVADDLANFTMDSARTWSRSFDWPIAGHDLRSCNLAAWSDGGTRRHACSASA